MYMKKHESRTQCPEKSRTFMSKIRTFTSNRSLFCRKPLLCDDNLSDQFGFSRAGADSCLWESAFSRKVGTSETQTLWLMYAPTPTVRRYLRGSFAFVDWANKNLGGNLQGSI
jgi:hypothetical protein